MHHLLKLNKRGNGYRWRCKTSSHPPAQKNASKMTGRKQGDEADDSDEVHNSL